MYFSVAAFLFVSFFLLMKQTHVFAFVFLFLFVFSFVVLSVIVGVALEVCPHQGAWQTGEGYVFLFLSCLLLSFF